MRQTRKLRRGSPKIILRLPDLDHSKAHVLQSLGSIASKRMIPQRVPKGLKRQQTS